MYREIKKCRLTKTPKLISVLNLGFQHLTGIFPSTKDQRVEKGPLELVWSKEGNLLQLKHTYDLDQMYGENYGYRSGLNQSMVQHLNSKVKYLESIVSLNKNDLIIDIGSNDATTLKAYSGQDLIKVGIDPTGEKFEKYYTNDIHLITDFFPTDNFEAKFPGMKAKIITTIAMFYDLEDPLSFVKSIAEVLHDEGIWHLEQSYLPLMFKANAYDTVCHEHLEYYTLGNIKYMVEKFGLKIIDVQTNDINGGSFAVSVVHESVNNYLIDNGNVERLLAEEEEMELNTLKPYRQFEQRVFQHKKDLKELVFSLVADGKKVIGYGASTKGNVLLQFCGFTENEIPFIAEVNEDKFGHYTPGTKIPIISESEAKKLNPDYFLVLPWHFKKNILKKESDFIKNGGKFIFPLPEIQIV
jgi:hypothetical protein